MMGITKEKPINGQCRDSGGYIPFRLCAICYLLRNLKEAVLHPDHRHCDTVNLKNAGCLLQIFFYSARIAAVESVSQCLTSVVMLRFLIRVCSDVRFLSDNRLNKARSTTEFSSRF